MTDPIHDESVDECLSVMAIEHEWRADVVRRRIEALEKWQREAVIAMEAATTIGERHGTPLNYCNHDRLLREVTDDR